MGIALLCPYIFFQGMQGILMLIGVYCGAIYGGSISAILIIHQVLGIRSNKRLMDILWQLN
jgi:TctA family transporter